MSTSRLPRAQYLMELAIAASKQSTCSRRSVGFAAMDKDGRVLCVAYNGVASGRPHCNEGHPCLRIDAAPGLDECEGIHAEQNGLMLCGDIKKIDIVAVTTKPCRSCVKLLLGTSCVSIYYRDDFPDPTAERMWATAGRYWRQV